MIAIPLASELVYIYIPTYDIGTWHSLKFLTERQPTGCRDITAEVFSSAHSARGVLTPSEPDSAPKHLVLIS